MVALLVEDVLLDDDRDEQVDQEEGAHEKEDDDVRGHGRVGVLPGSDASLVLVSDGIKRRCTEMLSTTLRKTIVQPSKVEVSKRHLKESATLSKLHSTFSHDPPAEAQWMKFEISVPFANSANGELRRRGAARVSNCRGYMPGT